jgi:uncharacterized membrane protein
MAAIPLSRNHPATLNPNAIAVLNPVAYIPQTGAYWVGEIIGLPPLVLFYLGRLAGAVTGMGLTYFAIRRMPFRSWSLGALAMLPTIVFSRSTLDADQVTNALSFFFTASVLAAMVHQGRISTRSLAVLVASAFLIAQSKSAYLVLAPLALAIPAERYGSRRRWILASALIVLPGAVASIGWMFALKYTFFAGMRYHTWAGNVYPDGQMAHILAYPLTYLAVLLRTVFATNFLASSLLGFIGVFGPPVGMPLIFYILLLASFALTLTGEGAGETQTLPPLVGRLALCAFVTGFVLILTLLYVQWDGLDTPTVQGFQGRYLYPLAAPLLVLLPRRISTPPLGLDAKHWAGLLGLVSLFGTVLVTWTTYWGG